MWQDTVMAKRPRDPNQLAKLIVRVDESEATRKDRWKQSAVSRTVGGLGGLILTALITGGWYSIAFIGAIGLGAVIAVILYRSRNGEL